nr:MAG TPA: chromosome partition protein [Caudoviricetes sp.]
MQEMILKSLQMQNFKGIENLSIDFKNETIIEGANGSGKTSIFDAYSWLLWDKDSNSRKDFDIKPFAVNGETKHGLESIVTGIFEIDGQSIKLSKTYKEIWTKKRGNTEPVFSGNTTDYFINDVPVKKSEYNQRIETFISEKEFNLLCNPLYFSEILDKKERRAVLLSLINDVKKEDVIAIYKDLKELDLENYTIEEIKAMAKASAKKTNQEIESLPIRIDELEKSKNDFGFEDLEKQKAELEKQIANIDKAIAKSSESTNVIAEKNSIIQSKFEEMQKIKLKIDEINQDKQLQATIQYNQKYSDFFANKDKIQRTITSKKTLLEELKENIKITTSNILVLKDKLQELRQKWTSENQKQFDGSLICPTCKREFEESKKNEIIADFNKQKSEVLTRIEKQANETKEVIEKAEKDLIELQNKKEEVNNTILEIELEYKNLGDFNEERPIITKEDYPVEYYTLKKEIEIIKQELQAISNNDNSIILEQKQQLQNGLNDVVSKLALKDNNKFIDEKIKNYLQQEKELAKIFEEQQRKLYLCDEYIRIYTSLVQNKINDLFKTVDFRLFETQVNGEIKETCEVTVSGVPYPSVNNAGKINAGLDVINSLSKHFEKRVPIFVDNAESITDILPVESQIVKLYVAKNLNLQIL